MEKEKYRLNMGRSISYKSNIGHTHACYFDQPQNFSKLGASSCLTLFRLYNSREPIKWPYHLYYFMHDYLFDSSKYKIHSLTNCFFSRTALFLILKGSFIIGINNNALYNQ